MDYYYCYFTNFVTTIINKLQISDILLALLGLFLFSCIHEKLTNKGPTLWPIVGMIPSFALYFKDIHEWNTKALEKSGGSYRVRGILGGFPGIMVADPVKIEYILKTNFKNFPKGVYYRERFNELLGNGIFNSDDEEWKEQRRIATSEMHTSRFVHYSLKTMQSLVHDKLLKVIEKQVISSKNQAMDLQELLLRFTFDNVCVAAFGVDPGCLALDLPEIPFAKAFEDATEYSLFRFLVPAVVWKIGSYRWDDKLLLALSAFATVFGEFWVIIQAQSQNPLAASIALLKQYPNSFSMFEPIRHIELQDETVIVAATKSSIYVAAYWIVKSIIACVSLITNLRSLQDEQVHLLAQNAEQKMHMKLVNAFQEPHFDNQDVLRLLFGQRNDLPLKHSSAQAKVAISSLKNKIAVLLISKPELLPVNELLLLVQQTFDHPLHNNLKQSYDILWVPISTSKKWSNNDITIFNLLSNSLPWYSIRQPWSLSSTTINYAKAVWQYHEQPIMVVLDPTGMVLNINAIDMVWIWGMKAYPFSFSREEELWRNERWHLRILLDSIDPLSTMWVEEGKSVCIYGSNKREWVREFTAEIKNIQSLAAQLELVYVGNKDHSAVACSIVSDIEREKLSHTLSMTKILLFWVRIQSIKRSRLKFNQRTDTDQILREVTALLDTCNDDDWMIFGSGSSSDILKLHGKEWAIFLSRYPLWKRYLPQIGLVEAIRRSLEPPITEPCTHSRFTTYNQEQMEETTFCDICKRPMEKFYMYDVVEQAYRIQYD